MMDSDQVTRQRLGERLTHLTQRLHKVEGDLSCAQPAGQWHLWQLYILW